MLPNILDVAAEHGLTFQPRSYGKKQTLAKCPFCLEDDQPRKRKKYYLSLNTHEQVFKCWYCGESGGVFRFMALLEGVSENEVIDRYRKKSGSTYQRHPAEKSGVLFIFRNWIVSVCRHWKTIGKQKSITRSCSMNSYTVQAIKAVLPAKGLHKTVYRLGTRFIQKKGGAGCGNRCGYAVWRGGY